MKRSIVVLVVVLAVSTLALVGAAWAAEKPVTTVVVVPLDDKPFKVGEKDLVRLSGHGIAGSKIEAKVDGPAKVVATGSLSQRKNGKPVIGNSLKDFLLKPSDKGKVKVTITVTPPQPDAKPRETVYEFEVE